MTRFRFSAERVTFLFIAIAGTIFTASAEMSRIEKEKNLAAIETFRKGDFSFTIMAGTAPLAGQNVTVEQTRHHFGFGAAMPYWPFDSASIAGKFERNGVELTETRLALILEKFGETFAKYFQWITPENEQKWTDVQYQRGADNYYKGDSLVAFARRNDIRVRGHNLFWNQHMGWIPDWVDTIAYNAWAGDASYFDTGIVIIDQRIEECLEHFKGQCAHWDIINEIVNGEVQAIELDSATSVQLPRTMGALEAITNMGVGDIYAHILKKAEEVDPDPEFCLNDYNIVTQWSNREAYINVVKALASAGCKIDILGCEGHFGDQVDASDCQMKINDVAGNFPEKKIWLTEVDWEIDIAQCAQKLDELLTMCFANQRVGGFMLWTPWAGNRWREHYTSYLFDSTFTETPMGARWLELIDGWTTPDQQAATGSEGSFSFNGYYGTYRIAFAKDGVDYEAFMECEPGGDNNFTFQLDEIVPVNRPVRNDSRKKTVVLGNGAVSFSVPQQETKPLYLSVFSLSGKLLEKVPLSFTGGITVVRELPSGCNVYRIGTVQKVYHIAKGMSVR
jgi:GH35 family endo-1,4-beta-xylanase